MYQNEHGSLLQKESIYTNDVISFVFEELNKYIHIVGKIKNKLFVNSDCGDTS